MSNVIQLLGGLDLSTAATHAGPGTLQECLNFEVALTDGYRRIDGYQRFDGRLVPEFGGLYTLRAHYGFLEGQETNVFFSVGTGGALTSSANMEIGDSIFYFRAESYNQFGAPVFSVGAEGIIFDVPEFVERNQGLGEFVDLSVRTGLIFFPVSQGLAPGVDSTSVLNGAYIREDIRQNRNFLGNVAIVNNAPEIVEVDTWSDFNIRLNTTFAINRQSVQQHPGGNPLGQHWFQERLYSVAESFIFGVALDGGNTTLDNDVLALVEEGQWFYYVSDYAMLSEGPASGRSPRSLINGRESNTFLVTGRIMSAIGGSIEVLIHQLDPRTQDRVRAPEGADVFLLTQILCSDFRAPIPAGGRVETSGGYSAIVRHVDPAPGGSLLLVETESGSVDVGDTLRTTGNDPIAEVESVFGGSLRNTRLCVLGENDDAQNAGVLVRSTSNRGFEPVPMGYEIRFEDGENRPLTIYDREDEDAGAATDTGDLTTGSVGNRSLGTGGQNWNAGGSIPDAREPLSNTAKVAAAGRLDTTGTDFVGFRLTNIRSHFLVLQDLGIDLDSFDRVTGITITLQVGRALNDRPVWLAAAGYYDPDEDRVWARELNQPISVALDANTEIEIGGPDELFRSGSSGQRDLSPSLVNDRRFGVAVQFRTNSTQTAASAVEVRVFRARVKVHYRNGSTDVFLYDGDNDLAQLRAANVYVKEGEWGGEETPAKGVLSVLGTINQEVPDGVQIRNGPNGTGVLIATADGSVQRARLPNRRSLDTAKSQFEFKTSNFFASEELEAVYGVSGAGLPFTFSEDYFFFFRTGVPEEKLRPRHVGRIQDRLVLSYENGNADLSTPGEPLDFDALTGGAATLGVGEKITGLLQLQGDTLAVFTESQIIAWQGADNQQFRQNTISPSSGAIEYTVVDMGVPIYCDFRGIGTIATSERFGDFQTGRLSEAVHRWLSPRLQGTRREDGQDRSVAGVALVRNKSQYRVIFRDGWVLTMTMRGQNPEFTTQKYLVKRDDLFAAGNPSTEFDTPVAWETQIEPIRFRSACWGVMDSGQDRIFLSADNYPHVLELDRGNSFDGQAIQSYIVTNPVSFGEPGANARSNVLHVYGRINGFATLDQQVGVNYDLPSGRPVPFTLGNPDSTYEPGERPAFGISRTDIVGRDISLRINHVSASEQPFVLQAYNWPDASPRRMER